MKTAPTKSPFKLTKIRNSLNPNEDIKNQN